MVVMACMEGGRRRRKGREGGRDASMREGGMREGGRDERGRDIGRDVGREGREGMRDGK